MMPTCLRADRMGAARIHSSLAEDDPAWGPECVMPSVRQPYVGPDRKRLRRRTRTSQPRTGVAERGRHDASALSRQVPQDVRRAPARDRHRPPPPTPRTRHGAAARARSRTAERADELNAAHFRTRKRRDLRRPGHRTRPSETFPARTAEDKRDRLLRRSPPSALTAGVSCRCRKRRSPPVRRTEGLQNCCFSCAPGRIRTCDTRFRSEVGGLWA